MGRRLTDWLAVVAAVALAACVQDTAPPTTAVVAAPSPPSRYHPAPSRSTLPRAASVQPQPVPPATRTPEEPKPPADLPDAEIARLLVEASRRGYPGSCACPYDVDRAGRKCGARSAYSRPGGRAPLCYPEDVSRGMIESYR